MTTPVPRNPYPVSGDNAHFTIDPLKGGGGGTGTSPGPSLSPDQQSAYDVVTDMLKQWGLESLFGDVLKFVQSGMSQQQITIALQDTDAYKTRFAGNEIRRKKGMPVLSPAEYLATEQSYRQILSSNGLPVGFYDQPSDFADWIGKDVSPTEINQRVGYAVSAAQRVDAGTKQAFQNFYGVGQSDLAAFFLDQDRALPMIQKQARAAQIGAAGYNNGVAFTKNQAESLATSSLVQDSQIDMTVAQAAAYARDAGKLAQFYNDNYDVNTAAAELFQSDAAAKKKREDLTAQERATFSGSSGLSRSGLAQNTGSY